MNSRFFALLGLCGFGLLSVSMVAPASACTPHPDNPSGCDVFNPGRIRVIPIPEKFPPKPGPACLSCPHDLTLDKSILINPLPDLIQRPQSGLGNSGLVNIPSQTFR